MLSRLEERGEVLGLGSVTSWAAAAGFLPAIGALLGLAVAALGYAMDLDSAFLGFASSPMVATLCFLRPLWLVVWWV
jgi:hypothetical protein